MLFNSLDFAVFLPVVFVLYWFVFNRSVRIQNVLLVAASYVFYSWWDWRFLFLILTSTLIDYGIGRRLGTETIMWRRRAFVGLSVLVNLGLLGFFKYFNFFLESFVDTFTLFGLSFQAGSLDIVLPVGISFYTFQTLSYTIDVYRKKLQPTYDFIAFTAFVSFFPQLVAGPIERATHFLPQFFRKRQFHRDEAIIGLKQILWGLFKKLVIADSCALYSDAIFDHYESYSSATLLLGVFYFAIRMYCDFSGYSDIAIGTARLFDFKLSVNFRYPFFARNIADYWRRWHISLSTWFRDYVFIPLGGSRNGSLLTMRNVMVVFVLSGLWHGASWNFVLWGILCGILYILFSLRSKKKYSFATVNPLHLPSARALLDMSLVFSCMAFTRVFFRTDGLWDALAYFRQLMEFTFAIDYIGVYRYSFELIPLILILFIWEWHHRNKEFPLYSPRPEFLKSMVVILLIVVFGNFEEVRQFYYFRF